MKAFAIAMILTVASTAAYADTCKGSAAEKKLGRGRLARGIRDDETGNDKEYFNTHPAEPCEGRGGRVQNIGGDGALETRDADRNPGPGPEHLVKNRDAEGGPEAQRIQQGKMVLHGSASNP